MSLFGPFMGLLALIIIGLGFFWVICAERALGWQWWYVFAGAGLTLVVLSIFRNPRFFRPPRHHGGFPRLGLDRAQGTGGESRARVVYRQSEAEAAAPAVEALLEISPAETLKSGMGGAGRNGVPKLLGTPSGFD